jgi:hypothetical protein
MRRTTARFILGDRGFESRARPDGLQYDVLELCRRPDRIRLSELDIRILEVLDDAVYVPSVGAAQDELSSYRVYRQIVILALGCLERYRRESKGDRFVRQEGISG